MPSPEEIFANWSGIIDDDLTQTISKTFELPENDAYIYRAEAFAMTLAEIHDVADKLKYKYHAHGEEIEVQKTIQFCSVVLTDQGLFCRHNMLHLDFLSYYQHCQSSYCLLL